MVMSLKVLMLTAASVGFFHTLLGPDHYVPFIVMAKARKWSIAKTVWVTIICGLGHVGSSVVLGLVGVGLGTAVSKLEGFEAIRGEIAGWALIAFGLVYFIYGIRVAIKRKPHTHKHFHGDGSLHAHEHTHFGEHSHFHEKSSLANPVPWTLFVVFVLGPCEPLIPLLIYPAATIGSSAMWAVAAVFSLVTIVTMVGSVVFAVFGLNFIPDKFFSRFSHALAGVAILMCGCAIQFLGL